MNTTAKQKLILVIDDDRMVQKLLDLILTQGGYAVKGLADATKVLDILKDTSPDLIILDLSMPHMSGFDVLKLLFERGVYTPVIVLSAASQQHNVQYVLDLGARYFISKPFKKEFVLQKVKEVIG